MNCPGCNFNIPDESKFCKECGFNHIEHDSKQVEKKSQRSPSSITVLIVDDNNFMRIVLKKLLSKHGFNVAGEASDAEDAVKIYKELSRILL